MSHNKESRLSEEEMMRRICEAGDFLQGLLGSFKPMVGLVLGSGLGDLAEEILDPVVVDYRDVPHFPRSTVPGHAGRFVAGKLQGQDVLCMQGRFHYYEGYSMFEVTLPIRVMQYLGIGILIVTNACGGMNRDFAAGDLMLINDHINMTGDNPLIGENLPEFGPRFPDMSEAYCPRLRALAREVGRELGIKLQEGVYVSISGPSYCTPAELIFLRKAGGDTVGMSTVPEVIVANHGGQQVLGISCVTDMAIGEDLEKLDHEMVVAMANKTKPRFITLVKGILERLADV
ncbi:MAG: Purine nucleoside phosphorylase 1 [Chloroflexi bacterium]|nr:Purine nucleoside phosphorylase 1 [Chloroflexota bacterium]